MAGERALVDETTLTELRANANTVVKGLSERSISEPVGCLTMGASIQPSRGTGEVVNAQKEPPKRDNSCPSSLHSTSTSCSSYSLEISVSTAESNNSNKDFRPLPLMTPAERRICQNSEAKPPSPLVQVPSATQSYRASDPKQLQNKEQKVESKFSQCQDKNGPSEIVTPKSPSIESHLEKTYLSSPFDNRKVEAQPVSSSQPPNATSTQQRLKHDSLSSEKLSDLSESSLRNSHLSASQGEEDIFYAFVILHAQEDTEEALKLKSRLESISSTTGATFSEDFAVPGQSTFRCVEEAIENSAFVMLMLTPNFNTQLNEMNADSALLNSIEKPHKSNTVIPLLPRVNGLPRDQMPLVLKTKNPLEEMKEKTFENMVRRVLDWKKIQTQKSMWRKAQQLKKQREKQERLREKRRYCADIIRESTKVCELEKEVQQLQMQQPPSYTQQFHGARRPQSFAHMPFQSPMPSYYSDNMCHQPPSNIHIQNAKYIMIGNNSTMTVGGGVESGDEDNF
ncbi:TIR domain-containing adapter molecule 1 [Silurus asotus]|uniref:TIR domain-containing adapter molecule 1 n=1 Tax=Silurus asotus TaxID=30991 RepID=A0AAD5FRH7_SILAS|nr:TIR domain-containing adapter molecule 1 [Silurus asotus]